LQTDSEEEKKILKFYANPQDAAMNECVCLFICTEAASAHTARHSMALERNGKREKEEGINVSICMPFSIVHKMSRKSPLHADVLQRSLLASLHIHSSARAGKREGIYDGISNDI
jgi:hypothetical protein